MRVEIVEVPASRESSQGIEAAAPPLQENRALNGFLAAVNGSDSFFRVEPTTFAFPDLVLEEGARSFRLTFRIGFSHGKLNRSRGLFFTLLEKTAELLREAGAADTLGVRLGLGSESDDAPGRASHRLVLELSALGSTPEQAELRWGLGLAHVQKALLFTSRQLRQQISSRGD
jgi:hypothetical protein